MKAEELIEKTGIEMGQLSRDMERAAEGEAEGAVAEWANTPGAQKLLSEIQNSGLDSIKDVKRNTEKGGFDITTKSGKKYNTVELMHDIKGKLSLEDIKQPNLKKALTDLGVDAKTLDDPKWKEVLERKRGAFEESPDTKQFRDFQKNKEGVSNRKKIPKDEDDFAKNNQKEMEQMKKKLEELEKDGKKPGNWLKNTAKLALAGLAAAELYGLIKEHQHKMNGCWLVRRSDNAQPGTEVNKCKIKYVTCNQDCWAENIKKGKKGDSAGFKMCEVCTDQKKTGTKNVICLGKDEYVDFNPTTPGCTESGKIPDTWFVTEEPKNGTCRSKCPCPPFDSQPKTNPVEPLCGDDSQSCSDTCKNGHFVQDPTVVFQCVDVNFWEAANDFVDGALSESADVIGDILKIVIKIVIVVIGIALTLAFVKVLFNIFTRPRAQAITIQAKS